MISVLIPFAGNNEWRLRSLQWVARRYRELGWEVVTGRGNPARWCKAEAVDDALDRAHGETLVVADADCWSNGIRIVAETVDTRTGGARQRDGHVRPAATWGIPHTYV